MKIKIHGKLSAIRAHLSIVPMRALYEGKKNEKQYPKKTKK